LSEGNFFSITSKPNKLAYDKTSIAVYYSWRFVQVSSMCILASLDRFFDFMALPNYDINQKQTESSNAQKAAENEDFSLEAKINSGIDRVVGVVDTCYIQHCCPALMVITVILLNFLFLCWS
jgi:hypothetical protein